MRSAFGRSGSLDVLGTRISVVAKVTDHGVISQDLHRRGRQRVGHIGRSTLSVPPERRECSDGC